MKLSIENGILYIDNKRFCFAKVQDDGSKDVQPGPRKVSTQYNHHRKEGGRVQPWVADLGWIGDDASDAIRIGSVLHGGEPLKCTMSLGGLVARIEACEEFGIPVLMEIR